VNKIEPSEAHTSASVASLETRLQNLERTTPKAGAAAGVAAASLALMETRLHKIEATLAQTSESLRKVRAPVADPELMQRLERLEKAGGAAKRPSDKQLAERAKKIDQRLVNIDKRLAELTKAQALTSRHLAGVMDKTKEQPAKPATRISHLNQKPEKKPEKRVEKPQHKTRLVTHTVRRGQTLYGLARRYGVKVADIRRWNPKLQNRKNLWINEDLIIYTTR
jgi:LysM repeat protein